MNTDTRCPSEGEGQFKGDGADVAKAGVQPGAVVEGLDVVEDRGARFGPGGEAMMIDDLVFEAAPERLDEGVVVRLCHGRTVLCGSTGECPAFLADLSDVAFGSVA